MSAKIQVIYVTLLGSAIVWGVLSHQDAARQLSALEEKVTSLQQTLAAAKNDALAARVAQLEAREKRRAQPAKPPRPALDATTGRTDKAVLPSDGKTLARLKAALREEVATMVEAESDEASAAKREARKSRWRDGVMHSLADFVSDRELDAETAEKVNAYMARSITEGMAKWAKVEAQEMSFYEFRKEMRTARKAFEEEMADLLSEDDYAALVEAFPAKF